MNYRHAFHAGNFGDVVKHAALALILARLAAKPGPFFVLDAHAGIGRYDLTGVEARKTGEAEGGIVRALAGGASPHLAAYFDVVRAMNRGGGLRWYPGSPAIARALCRDDDRMVFAELHPEDGRRLRAALGADPRVEVRIEDGYAALKTLLPPREKRGLVLLDPPFEIAGEFDRLARAVFHVHRRWATGIVMAWYPIKDRAPVAAFRDALAASRMRRILAAELLVRPDDDAKRLNGCGVIVVNPPWRLDAVLAALLPDLLARFGATGDGRTEVAMLVPE